MAMRRWRWLFLLLLAVPMVAHAEQAKVVRCTFEVCYRRAVEIGRAHV